MICLVPPFQSPFSKHTSLTEFYSVPQYVSLSSLCFFHLSHCSFIGLSHWPKALWGQAPYMLFFLLFMHIAQCLAPWRHLYISYICQIINSKKLKVVGLSFSATFITSDSKRSRGTPVIPLRAFPKHIQANNRFKIKSIDMWVLSLDSSMGKVYQSYSCIILFSEWTRFH